MSSRWRAALADLRGRFSQNQFDLHHVLTLLSCKYVNTLGGFPTDLKHGHPWDKPFVSFGYESGGDLPGLVGHHYHGQSAGVEPFQSLAHSASKLIARRKDLVTLEEALETSNPVNHWVSLVHQLAWQHRSNSPLAAERRTWGSGRSGAARSIVILPYDEVKFPLSIDYWGMDFEAFDGPKHNPAEYYVSVLPDNIFQCSAWAIDLLLDLVPSSAAPDTEPSDTSTTGETGGNGSAASERSRKRRAKGSAVDLLEAALRSLAAKGLWGKMDTDIIDLADISRSSFYRLAKENNKIKRMMEEYRRRTLGRGPVRVDDL
jgi:hypothetical protein